MSVDLASTARTALVRHAWAEAFEGFQAADTADGLSGDDLEAYAMAAWFVARPELAGELLERTFQRHTADGNTERAGFIAVRLAREQWFAGRQSMASGWLRRAERLVSTDGDGYVQGYIALAASEQALGAGDLDRALSLAERALAISEKATDADLRAWAWSNMGELKILSGEPTVGVGLLEEASLAAVNGELSPIASGITACRMISACRDLTDYRRAAEWIEATERYCRAQSLEAFPGVCRVHRAEIASVSGEWAKAESDLQLATVDLERFRAMGPASDGYYALGDVRRLKGDFEGAETALREAHARGHDPQPAMALLRLAQGDIRGASVGIDAALVERASDRWGRARLLPTQVEVALAAGDAAKARTAVDELEAVVSGYPSPAFLAGVHTALGRVLEAEGDHPAAAHELRAAIRAWQDVGAPYEVARCRLALVRALWSLGDLDDADLELRAAIDAFRRLGAVHDLERAERMAREADERRVAPTTSERTFMFTDIVSSTTLAESVGDEVWASVLRWHDETLRGLIVRGHGKVVNPTGDGFFASFESAREGVDTAIAIQRALRDHRRDSGYPARVRIGLHRGEATERGGDYGGLAVHVAARIAALAEADAIVVSEAALAAAGDIATTDTRSAIIKGVSESVIVANVTWS